MIYRVVVKGWIEARVWSRDRADALRVAFLADNPQRTGPLTPDEVWIDEESTPSAQQALRGDMPCP